MKILNIHSQLSENSEARIVGNQAGLLELVQAINKALANSIDTATSEDDCIFASDGEGYVVEVKLLPDDWHDPAWAAPIHQPHYCDRGYLDDTHKEGG